MSVPQERFGIVNSEAWRRDPRHLLFTFARYKFVAKMLAGRQLVLEVGCGECLGAWLVLQEVQYMVAADFDPLLMEDARRRYSSCPPNRRPDLVIHDFLEGPLSEYNSGWRQFDAIYALDVLEHIRPNDERKFLGNAFAGLDTSGAAIIGMPSLESQQYASEQSRQGHVNCKSGEDLRSLMQEYFDNVFLFSMNDEVVHTGFVKMAHYLLALCCGKR